VVVVEDIVVGSVGGIAERGKWVVWVMGVRRGEVAGGRSWAIKVRDDALGLDPNPDIRSQHKLTHRAHHTPSTTPWNLLITENTSIIVSRPILLPLLRGNQIPQRQVVHHVLDLLDGVLDGVHALPQDVVLEVEHLEASVQVLDEAADAHGHGGVAKS